MNNKIGKFVFAISFIAILTLSLVTGCSNGRSEQFNNLAGDISSFSDVSDVDHSFYDDWKMGNEVYMTITMSETSDFNADSYIEIAELLNNAGKAFSDYEKSIKIRIPKYNSVIDFFTSAPEDKFVDVGTLTNAIKDIPNFAPEVSTHYILRSSYEGQVRLEITPTPYRDNGDLELESFTLVDAANNLKYTPDYVRLALGSVVVIEYKDHVDYEGILNNFYDSGAESIYIYDDSSISYVVGYTSVQEARDNFPNLVKVLDNGNVLAITVEVNENAIRDYISVGKITVHGCTNLNMEETEGYSHDMTVLIADFRKEYEEC